METGSSAMAAPGRLVASRAASGRWRWSESQKWASACVVDLQHHRPRPLCLVVLNWSAPEWRIYKYLIEHFRAAATAG